MDILTMIVTGILCMSCFFVGSKTGQAVVKGKDIELPNVNPMKLYKAHKDNKEAEMKKNRMDIILKNIDRYDGTANGQEDVPR